MSPDLYLETERLCHAPIERAAYYAELVPQSTPVADILGRFPIDATARERLVFTHDEQGRITNIVFCIEDNLAHHKQLGAAVMTVKYSRNREVRSYWGMNGEPEAMWHLAYRGLHDLSEGDVHKEIFTLDDEGRRTSLRFRNRMNDTSHTHYGTAQYYWRWLDEDTVLETRRNVAGSAVQIDHLHDFANTRIHFDNGVHWLIENIDETGALVEAEHSKVAAVRYVHNGDNQITDMSFYSAHDRITEREAFGQHAHGYARQSMIYNAEGLLEERRFLNTSNQLVNTSNGVAREVFIYEDGRLMNVQRFKADGSPVTS